MKRNLPPKIEEVARQAGVSPATVSRFFNSPALLAASTAERIQSAVTELGYVPNLLAGGLASNRSRLVAVFVPEITQSIFNDTIEAMIEELSRDGSVVMLGITGPRNERMGQLIDAALARRAEAVILTGVLLDEATRERLRRHPTRVFETWGLPDDPIDFAVGFSHEAVGCEVARFLRQRGYTRPHLIVAEGSRARLRRNGFVAEWMRDASPAPTETTVEIPSRFGHGRLAFRRLQTIDPRPDVVVCGSDWLAQGVIVEALAAGVRVPDQLAVMGFGNLAVASEMRPTITTVDIDGAQIGRETVDILRREAKGEPMRDRKVDVGFRLIARESA